MVSTKSGQLQVMPGNATRLAGADLLEVSGASWGARCRCRCGRAAETEISKFFAAVRSKTPAAGWRSISARGGWSQTVQRLPYLTLPYLTSPPARAGSTWQWSSIRSPGASSAGAPGRLSIESWRSTPWIKPSRSDSRQRVCCITPIAACSLLSGLPATARGGGARRQHEPPRRLLGQRHGRELLSRPSRSSSVDASARGPRPTASSSTTSSASTTPAACTRASATAAPPSTSASTTAARPSRRRPSRPPRERWARPSARLGPSATSTPRSGW